MPVVVKTPLRSDTLSAAQDITNIALAEADSESASASAILVMSCAAESAAEGRLHHNPTNTGCTPRNYVGMSQ